ncbi:hypothetical protein I7I50_00487 [Histoplasma capsulatum G186AR]|uniref:Uncharacterized protein n=1 Tax=Ajellomyces capsulatus TaxID=5037 RepID=A0A8H7YE02_AJECA|nr:hypothetical protein I7I52_07755 [Histoplasma capsulatum]QSS72592.1 hypothetical protein I7I50_00487 [Histoplasma capsulatum G186AR]
MPVYLHNTTPVIFIIHSCSRMETQKKRTVSKLSRKSKKLAPWDLWSGGDCSRQYSCTTIRHFFPLRALGRLQPYSERVGPVSKASKSVFQKT